MSLNGIMGIGISSVEVEDERREIVRAEGEAQWPVGGTKPDNLSAVQEDYVTLQSGVGLMAPAGALGGVALGQSERGSLFQAIA